MSTSRWTMGFSSDRVGAYVSRWGGGCVGDGGKAWAYQIIPSLWTMRFSGNRAVVWVSRWGKGVGIRVRLGQIK